MPQPEPKKSRCLEVNCMNASEVDELKRAVEEGSGLSWGVILEAYFLLRMEGLGGVAITSDAVLGRAQLLARMTGSGSMGGRSHPFFSSWECSGEFMRAVF